MSKKADSAVSTSGKTTRFGGPESKGSDKEFVLDQNEFGDTVGPYAVLEEIARGGMGVVLRCRDKKFKRDVAVKLLLNRHASSPHLRRRFLREARLTGQLEHPGVVPVYEIGIAQDLRPFFATQLISGKSLAELLESRRREETVHANLLSIFLDVCQTLAFVHSKNVIHLDLKPGNVMVGEFGEVFLLDWGFARRLRSHPVSAGKFQSERRRPQHLVQGTPSYMSPEQARGGELTTKSDVFGLGAILCEILTHHPPYLGESPKKVLTQAMMASLDPAFRELDSCRSELLIRLAKRCLSPDPADRPTDAREVANQVESYLESALIEIEADLERFFELSLDLFCIASFDGYFLRINSNFSRVLGYDESELLSRPFIEFVHEHDREQTVNRMGCLLHGGTVTRFQNRYRCVNGDYRVFEWTAKSIPKEKTIFAVARDVTPLEQY